MMPEIDVHAVKISREDREDPMITRYSHPLFCIGCESISGRKYPRKVPVNISALPRQKDRVIYRASVEFAAGADAELVFTVIPSGKVLLTACTWLERRPDAWTAIQSEFKQIKRQAARRIAQLAGRRITGWWVGWSEFMTLEHGAVFSTGGSWL